MKKIFFTFVMFMMLGVFASCACNDCAKTDAVEEALLDSAAISPALDTTVVKLEPVVPEYAGPVFGQPEDAADISQE